MDISYVQIRNICVKYGDSERLILKKEELELKKKLKEKELEKKE